MKKYFKLTTLIAVFLILVSACKEETPAPTATFTATVVSNVVTFAVTATDAETYEWDFGDGSVKSTIKNPTHTYTTYGTDYTVKLKVTGPGGTITVTQTVTIPAMTKMEMLTGGAAATNGKKWRMAASAAIDGVEFPDEDLIVAETFPAGILTLLGYTSVYQDEYIFKSNNSYTISPKGTGVFAGLAYCLANSVPNVPPSEDAAGAGLTLITPYTAPTGLTFTLNESKDLTIEVSDPVGQTKTDVVYNDVMTLSFSTGGFLGAKDFVTECIVQELTNSSMKVVLFVSQVPPQLPMVGKTTYALIITFEVVP